MHRRDKQEEFTLKNIIKKAPLQRNTLIISSKLPGRWGVVKVASIISSINNSSAKSKLYEIKIINTDTPLGFTLLTNKMMNNYIEYISILAYQYS